MFGFVFSIICLVPVLFLLLVSVQVIVWKDQLLRTDLVLQFVDGDVKPDSLAPMLAVNYTKLNSTQCSRLRNDLYCVEWDVKL